MKARRVGCGVPAVAVAVAMAVVVVSVVLAWDVVGDG
jgi:hypothetical protein